MYGLMFTWLKYTFHIKKRERNHEATLLMLCHPPSNTERKKIFIKIKHVQRNES